MWARIGVKAKLRTLPLVTYFPMIQRYEASIYMLGWGVPTFDALYSLQSLVRTVGAQGDGNYNVGRYSNPQVDALVERIKVEVDQKTRNELIEKALLLSHQDVSHIPLHNQVIPWAMKKTRRHGSPRGQPHRHAVGQGQRRSLKRDERARGT